MSATTAAQPPASRFVFFTSMVLQEATGLRAATLPQLLHLLQNVPDACVYHHTHDFLLAHHYLTPEPSNDFAYWVTEVLGEEALGERLASIDTVRYTSLRALRQALVEVMAAYLAQHPFSRLRFASEGEEFFFIKSLQIVLRTPYSAATIPEFAEAIAGISVHSLYFHMFDARLRLGRPTNDFSLWFDQQGLGPLAEAIARLDPYAQTLESLRGELLRLIRRHTHSTPEGTPLDVPPRRV